MPKTPVMVRLDDDELAELDRIAGEQKISRATCATAILRQRIGTGPARTPATKPVESAPAPRSKTPTQVYEEMKAEARKEEAKVCPHKYRNNHGFCLTCGHQL